jgi:hypothetical protein
MLLEPMMPAEGDRRLEDLSVELAEKASALNNQVNPKVRQSMSTLVRSMNCYYSNLIEGHNTHPIEIDRALAGDYSQDDRTRCLQLEARSHIEVHDQVEFMQSLLEPRALLRRIERYVELEVQAQRLPKGAFPLLREALIFDEFERGKAATITGYQERQARTVLRALLDATLLVSDQPKGKVYLGFPISIVSLSEAL